MMRIYDSLISIEQFMIYGCFSEINYYYLHFLSLSSQTFFSTSLIKTAHLHGVV